MAVTFNFEELDATTRDYLTAVRSTEGAGAPGVFVPTSDSMQGCGCISGIVVMALTLMFTLTTWVGVIYDDPMRVALLQTAGLLLGGWLFFAGFRGKGGKKMAGAWVYADSLFLYEAFRENVTVTAIDDVVDANFTHNYNNGSYQNSVINISLAGNKHATATVNNEARAEQMVVFLNYLAWARGTEGGDRANLPPATLGGLAKYVARNDHEPLDADNNINLNLIELEIDEIPEQPAREGRSMPGCLPYVIMLIGGVVCFFVMSTIVNPPLRDNAIYDAVMKPGYEEPRFLRAYLIDPRNKIHRDKVAARLSRFYFDPMQHVEAKATDNALGTGMSEILKSLSTADQPVVSLRITETKPLPGKADTKGSRESTLRTLFADGVNNAFASHPWGYPIQPQQGMTFKEQPPPIGHQLIAFVEAPEDANAAHFDIAYAIEAEDDDQYRIVVNVTLRTNIEDKEIARSQLIVPKRFTANDFAANGVAFTAIRDELILRLVGPPAKVLPGVIVPLDIPREP